MQPKGGGYEAATWVPRLPGDEIPLLLDLTRILETSAVVYERLDALEA